MAYPFVRWKLISSFQVSSTDFCKISGHQALNFPFENYMLSLDNVRFKLSVVDLIRHLFILVFMEKNWKIKKSKSNEFITQEVDAETFRFEWTSFRASKWWKRCW